MSQMNPFVEISKIKPNPQQPRTVFDEAEMRELADSIRERGLQSAILVEDNKDGTYTLVAGERRLRAHKILGLSTIKANIRPKSSDEILLLDATVENVQRKNMNVVDEANAYLKMYTQFRLSVRTISKKTGVNETRIRSLLKIAELAEPIKKMIAEKKFPHSGGAIEAVYSIPEDKRVAFVTALAERRASIKVIKASATRLISAMNGKTIKRSPAFAIAEKTVSRQKGLPDWNALKQAGKLPPWELFSSKVEQTCDSCSLRAMASDAVCRDCPLPDFIKRIMEVANV
jgi:ParB/RepB/Spo0J family partition protein